MNLEYPIWGVPPGKTDEDLLYTKAKTLEEAQAIVKKLETIHGCTKCRIQVLDLDIPPDFGKIVG